MSPEKNVRRSGFSPGEIFNNIGPHPNTDLFHFITANVGDLIAVLDLDGRRVYSSPSYLQTLGNPDLLKGTDSFAEVHPQDRDRVRNVFRKTVQTGIGERMEYRFLRADGNIRYIESQGNVVRDKDGNISNVIVVSRDITERKRTDKVQHAIYKISESANLAENMHKLFQSIHQVIAELMPAKNFYIALYEPTSETISFPYFTDEYDVQPLPKKLGKGLTEYVLRTGKPILASPDVFKDLVQKNEVESIGSPSIDWLGVPLRTKERIIGVLVVQSYTEGVRYSDEEKSILIFVSEQIAMAIERKRAEDEISEWKKRYELVVESSGQIVYDYNVLTGDILWSGSINRVLGYRLDEMKGGIGQWKELIHDDDREEAERLLEIAVKSREPYDVEYRFRHKNGDYVWIHDRGLFTRNGGEEVVRMLGMMADVTSRKRLEAQYLRIQRMEGIGTLAGGIAHDLNNVLAPILLSLEIFRKKFTDSQSQQMLSIIESSARRGAEMVKQVLTFARGIDAERITVQTQHLIKEMEKILRETFPRDITIRTEIQKNLWTIAGDATQLHQVLLNLCVNARDAMPEGGTLLIGAENVVLDDSYVRMQPEAKAGKHIILKVSDTGIGIPTAVAGKIFEPFFTTKEVGKGTGFGLSTVHSIVKSHGGFIDVDSEVRKGTTFRVYLPANDVHEDVSSVNAASDIPAGHGETILVIDDEISIQEVTRDTLESHGYKVLTANDGTEALAVCAQFGENIALCLTDMMMPYMDGASTIRALRKIRPSLKIIASSGLATNAMLNGDHEGKIEAFLHKPYTAEKLLAAIHQALSGS